MLNVAKMQTHLGLTAIGPHWLTKAHLQSVEYDAKYTVGLVQRAVFGHKELDQAKTTSPSAPKKEKDAKYITLWNMTRKFQ